MQYGFDRRDRLIRSVTKVRYQSYGSQTPVFVLSPHALGDARLMRSMKLGLMLSCLACFPTMSFGQAGIAGSVRDESGGLLAGVVVVASSSALIEKTRTTVTDSNGRYRLENLRLGTYAVRFTLKGFRPSQQEGIELMRSSTAVLDATLVLGAVTDSITVAGDMPVVDVRNAGREITLSGEVVNSIPSAGTYNALLPLVPGVVTGANDTVTAPATTSFPMYGGRTNEGRLMLNGLTIGSPPSGNSATSYASDVNHAEEVTFEKASALGESETSGLVVNIVAKSGGNTTHGSFFAGGTGRGLQSNNLTEALMRQGVTAATPLRKVYDISAALGGPIVRNRLWYFVDVRSGGSSKDAANVYYNMNAGASTKWLYAPDFARPEYSDRTYENAGARLTWQATPRNQVSGFWDVEALCRTCTGATASISEPQRVSPEAVGVLGRRLDVTQARWSSSVTNRLSLDVAFGSTFFGVGNFERNPNPTRQLIRVAEQCASGCEANGNIPGLVYRSQDFSDAHTGSYLWKESVSYVTGTHSLKIGHQHTLMTDDRVWMTNDQNLTYRFSNGVPNQLTQSISPWVNDARVAWDAVFVQEQWSLNRVTLQGAVRFDRARSWFPAQQEGPSRFLPNPIVIPKTRGVDSYKDFTPRLGVVYDVFGGGKTVLRMSLGRYLEGAGVSGNYANANPTLRLPQTTTTFGTAGVTRAWTDANQNFVADCDLLNPGVQDLRPRGGDFCGVLSNTNFGKNILTNNFDPAILNGWGVRPSDWNLGLSIQQQIRGRSSVEVAYIRRQFRGFFVVDNLSLQPSDLTPFTLVAPIDPRLPGGGGYAVSGLYDVVPEKSGQVDNFITDSARYGSWSQDFQGIDVTVNVRARNSFTLTAGTSSGQTVADSCDVRAQLPELSTATTGTSAFGAGLTNSAVTPASPYCRVASGVLTQLRGLVSYVVPKADVQLSATFQNKPGAMLSANYAATNEDVAPSLGRPLSGNASNVTVNLVTPGTMYGNRINQLDARVAKILRVGRSRTRVGVDVYNTLNSGAVLTYNTTFVPGGTWLQPVTILTPRLFKISAEVTF
jgi:Carboxypeptidase regulatory-like domain